MSDEDELVARTREGIASKELFRRLVEGVRDYAIFMLDPNGRIASWNVGAQRIKGYSAGEIIGKHFSIFYLEDEVRAGKCEYELEVAARVGRFEDEGWRVRKDGSRFWANVVINVVHDDHGGLWGFSKVTRDLTERKRAEEERAARLAAEQANRAKDEFLAMLGHELRNPLAPIVTALQLMKLRGDPRTSREQQVVERQVKHMMRLVDDLLDVSRITKGTVELKRRPVDVRDVVAKAIEIASPLLEQRGHALEVDAPPGEVVVDGDDARLTQVFANLLVNAAKYTDPGGHVSVRVGQDDGVVVVEVRDDGRGIEPGLLPNVFDLFVQGHQGSERSSGGLGIGLTLVRTLVGLHGGVVTAHSGGRGAGSTFVVRLPALAGAHPTSSAARLPTPVGFRVPKQSYRILLVDDNEDALALLADLLSTAGNEVRTAHDAFAALEIMRGFSPDVAILDIGLPVMDGYALASRLRSELGAAAPRLIALSGYGQQKDRELSRQAGFDAHLVKPVDAQRLLDTIVSVGS
jgi:PAS domain S-box-containing protein